MTAGTSSAVHLLRTVMAGAAISAKQAAASLANQDLALSDLMAAGRAAAIVHGVRPFTCGIVSAKTGRCGEDCQFCPQSVHHQTTTTTATPLADTDTMLRRAEFLAGTGASFMGIVTSGTAPSPADFERICRSAEHIRAAVDIRLCASLGLLDASQAMELRRAGFTSYHHNLETSASFYPAICTTHSHQRRVDTVKAAKQAGLRVCSGGIFGIGESWRHRIELSSHLAELDVDSIPVNFLIPVTGTPMAGRPTLLPGEALAIVSLFRLMHPQRDIVICAGRQTLDRFDVLLNAAGANGIMVGDFLSTKGGSLEADLEAITIITGSVAYGAASDWV